MQRDAADARTAITGPVSDSVGSGHADAGELALVRQQLQEHLAASDSYDVAALLAQLAGTRLWEERVIVHAKARHQSTIHPFTITSCKEPLPRCSSCRSRSSHLSCHCTVLLDWFAPVFGSACVLS